jgi:hypothetical protein
MSRFSRRGGSARPFYCGLLVVTSLLAGCQTAPSRPRTEDSGLKITLRNNSYALLYQLLGQEKDVSLLSLIKHEHSDLKDVLKKIAKDSATGEKLLKKFAKADPTLDLTEIRLPPGEVATRAAIAAHEQTELLHQKGDPFEMTLLLTQAEAVNYGEFLAQVAAENETDPTRRAALEALSEQMAAYHLRLVKLIALR